MKINLLPRNPSHIRDSILRNEMCTFYIVVVDFNHLGQTGTTLARVC